MIEFILFLIGLMLGGSFGVIAMCLLQVNRLYDHKNYRKDDDNDETNS